MAALLPVGFLLKSTRVMRMPVFELEISFEVLIWYFLPLILLILVVAAELFAELLQKKTEQARAAKVLKTVCIILRILIAIIILCNVFLF